MPKVWNCNGEKVKWEGKFMRITTLVENTVNNPNLLAEHGLSILLETEDETILFDTGQGHAPLHNAASMGIDLSKIDKIILSHGHSDHTGGLGDALKASGGAYIYGHPGIFGEKYSKRKCEQRSIGIPYTRKCLQLRGAKLHLSRTPIQISDDIQTTGEIRRQNQFETIHDRLCVMRDGALVKDDLLDDLSLIVAGSEGVAVIFGCGHSGVINTLTQVRRMIGDVPISLVIGGIHLIDATEDRIERTAHELEKFNIGKLALCHCTGMLAMIRLYEAFGDKMLFNHVGAQIEWN
jgi:7,8-dihydropterin-6-yl-methyl-4-(beta-D-ribofuranosyl)aminobenzene 5'-phosphate synthase